ncbi:MAG: L,D-transpeptidase family protein [Alphaproteobacteria bacterium]
MTARKAAPLRHVLAAFAAAMTSLALTACVPGDGSAQFGPAQTGMIHMTHGLQLNPSFIDEVDSPSEARDSDVRGFYKDQSYYTTFYRNGRWTRAGALAFSTLRNAASEGLDPEAYLPRRMLRSSSLSTVDPQTEDVLLTAGLMAYLADVRQGVHNPEAKNIGPKLLRDGVERSDFGAFLSSVPPQGRSYRSLRAILNSRASSLAPARKKQIAVNLERLRWDPEVAGAARDIRVNIASQTMEIFERDKRVHAMSVVVGRTSRKTPVLQDEVVSLKFSPDWTAPRSIVQEDYLNHAQADPAYFDEKGWQVYLNGERTTSAAVDWTTVELDNVTVRQPSGATNALGGVRFSLTNSQAIYLHDTNAHSLFQKAQRLFSSGCVRVEDAAWLAHWIMRAEPISMTMTEVRENMDLSSPKSVRLAKPVPVAIAYMTVWVDGENTLHWEEDVYGHDKRLLSKMDFPAAWNGSTRSDD